LTNKNIFDIIYIPLKMNIFMAVYFAVLFFILSPNILLRLPQNGSKMTVAGVHAVVFGIVAYLTGKAVWKLSNRLGLEGMTPLDIPEEKEEEKKE
jgi:hypothetical protein